MILGVLVTDPDAASAKDALVKVPDVEGVAVVELMVLAGISLFPERRFLYSEIICYCLELAFSVAAAAEAVQRVTDEKKLYNCLAGGTNFIGVGIYNHSVHYRS